MAATLSPYLGQNKDCAAVACYRRITRLKASGCRYITDEGIQHLARRTNWIALDLSYSRITDEALISLARFPGLQMLNLRECAISDSGIAELIALTALQTLILGYSPAITDCSLAIFAKMPSLTTLRLIDCPNISTAGRQEFKRQHPNIDIWPLINLREICPQQPPLLSLDEALAQPLE